MSMDKKAYAAGYQDGLDEGGGGSSAEPLSVIANGTYTAPAGKSFNPVTVAVPGIETEALSATANGVYTAPSGKAYSPVTVAVPILDAVGICIVDFFEDITLLERGCILRNERAIYS